MNLPLYAIDLAALLILTYGLYMPRHGRKQLAVALIAVNVGVLAVSAILAEANLGAGLGLGLFGVLSIIRLRSTEISHVDIAYYFSSLALGLIAGLAQTVEVAAVLVVLILAALALADSPLFFSHRHTLPLVLDRAFSDEASARAYCAEKLGLAVANLEITRVDLVQDLTWVNAHVKGGRAHGQQRAVRCEPYESAPTMSAPTAVDHEACALELYPAITLEEVMRSAKLTTRTDKKYLLPAELLAEILAEVEGIRILEIDGRRNFSYSSLYFDTAAHDSYWGAAGKRRKRWKLRRRLYHESGLQRLELKTRNARGQTVKDQLTLPAEQSWHADLSGEEYLWACQAMATRGIDADVLAGCKQNVESHYVRHTYVSDEGVRLTVDANLELGDARSEESPRCILNPRLVVAEVKSPRGNSAIDRLLWRHGVRPIRISKFALAAVATNPELAGNRWHRALQQCVVLT